MRELNRMNQKQLMAFLKYERENGYPSFRNEIARVLCENYNFNFQNAKEIVWHDFIGGKIIEDIEWSQHMGPNYWAEFIRNNQDVLPKRIENLIPQS